MADLRFAFRFCDPVRSFSPGSAGDMARRLRGDFGEALGPNEWDLGRRAYARLTEAFGPEVTTTQLIHLAETWRAELDEFLQEIDDQVRSGLIEIRDVEGNLVSSPLHGRNEGLVWQITLLTGVVQAMQRSAGATGPTAPPVTAGFRTPMLVAALLALDDAVAASLSGAIADVASSVVAATSLIEQVEAADRAAHETQSLIKARGSARAAELARLKHAKDPKQEAKRFVYECWREWRDHDPERYDSATAFARDMRRKHPDTLKSDVVITRWVREWDKSSDAAPT